MDDSKRNFPAHAVVFASTRPPRRPAHGFLYLQVLSHFYNCKLVFYKCPILPHTPLNRPHGFPFVMTSQPIDNSAHSLTHLGFE